MPDTRGFLYLGLEDKVVLVTGGTGGIGAETVRQFAKIGAFPVFTGRDQEKGKALEKELHDAGYSGKFIQTDHVDEEQCKRAVVQAAEYGRKKTRTSEEYDKLDVLVNCAGYNDDVGIGVSWEEITDSLALNLVQYIFMSSECWKYLIKSGGNIVNIGSKTGQFGQKDSWAYAAANGGINALTLSAARNGADYGIRVNCVSPSEVDGEHYRKWAEERARSEGGSAGDFMRDIAQNIPLGRRMTMEREIADAVLILASPIRSSHRTGEIHTPGGGYPLLIE
jgi:L-fucose dehydrogenase